MFLFWLACYVLEWMCVSCCCCCWQIFKSHHDNSRFSTRVNSNANNSNNNSNGKKYYKWLDIRQKLFLYYLYKSCCCCSYYCCCPCFWCCCHFSPTSYENNLVLHIISLAFTLSPALSLWLYCCPCRQSNRVMWFNVLTCVVECASVCKRV